MSHTEGCQRGNKRAEIITNLGAYQDHRHIVSGKSVEIIRKWIFPTIRGASSMKNLMVSLLFIIVIVSFITNFFLEETAQTIVNVIGIIDILILAIVFRIIKTP